MGNLEKTDRQSVHCEYSPALTYVSAAILDRSLLSLYINDTRTVFVVLNGSYFLFVMAGLI